jgi:hypothetical protein
MYGYELPVTDVSKPNKYNKNVRLQHIWVQCLENTSVYEKYVTIKKIIVARIFEKGLGPLACLACVETLCYDLTSNTSKQSSLKCIQDLLCPIPLCTYT